MTDPTSGPNANGRSPGIADGESAITAPARMTRWQRYMRILPISAMLFATVPAAASQSDDAAAVAIARAQVLVVERGVPPARLAALLRPVKDFYGFWNNGSQTLLDRAISPDFVDHELPMGRPQGPMGPVVGWKGFVAAVPDLRITVTQRIVAGDRVTSLLHCTGHFTGTFAGIRGTGQTVDFISVDILRVRAGRITDNWHLEDNLTFLKQIGAVK